MTVIIDGQELTFAQMNVLAVALRTFHAQAKTLPADMLLKHKYVEVTEQLLKLMGEI